MLVKENGRKRREGRLKGRPAPPLRQHVNDAPSIYRTATVINTSPLSLEVWAGWIMHQVVEATTAGKVENSVQGALI